MYISIHYTLVTKQCKVIAMKNCAVVCEYNPFHSGHKYQLDTIREADPNNIVCVMSGSFTQSGLPAFCDKALRAECAVMGGADAVAELPAVYSTASAQIFAEGALKIISGIKNVSHIAMGAVSDRNDIMALAEIKIAHADEFSAVLKQEMQTGKSYNAASARALVKIYGKLHPDKSIAESVLFDPNSILCIEYIVAIDKYAAYIEPFIIKRRGQSHTDLSECGEHISATAVRSAALRGEFGTVKNYIPFKYVAMEKHIAEHSPDLRLYKNMAVYALKRSGTDRLSRLRDCSEGMEFLLKNMSGRVDFDDYINAAVGKRYGKKRIYRFFTDLLLGIDKESVDKKFCTRLLACKNGFDFGILPSCVKTSNSELKRSAEKDKDIEKVLDIDKNAVALYNTLCGINGDYFNYSLIKI